MRPCRRVVDEEGFTLPELLITTLLMGIVSLILFTTTTSLTQTAARTEARSQTLSSARTALERIARDLRAANPVDELAAGTPTSLYDSTVSFKVYCASGLNCTDQLRATTYRVSGNRLEAVSGATTTVLQGPEGSSTLSDSLRRGAIVNSSSEPVFEYYRRDGSKIATSNVASVGIPSTYFRDCTKKVKIHLKVRAQANEPSQVVDLVTTVTLRNHNEVNPC